MTSLDTWRAGSVPAPVCPDDADRRWEGPPDPDPDNLLLRVVIDGALQQLEEGVATPEQAITNAAVNAWREGHTEAEDTGCDCQSRD